MAKPTCYILSGIPSCGKSTWSRKFTAEYDNVVQVSRDEIRFSFLADGEDYFAHEDEVIATFYAEINEALAAGRDVIADATHISEKALKQTLRAIKIVVSFYVPLKVCLSRNAKREGRECVPSHVIKGMARSKSKLDTRLKQGKFPVHAIAIGKDY